MDHIKLLEETKKAIDRLFNDRSVDPTTTQDSLEVISDYIREKIEALIEDQNNNGG